MSDQDNGITQSPFSDAVVPVPSAQSGDQGIGGGLDADGGGERDHRDALEESDVPDTLQYG